MSFHKVRIFLDKREVMTSGDVCFCFCDSHLEFTHFVHKLNTSVKQNFTVAVIAHNALRAAAERARWLPSHSRCSAPMWTA